ncbi:hypothetical protein [Promicromonospora sp. NPDC057488]|uniref:hypothetical protein n=1 Tax=Promicromonospora sp. NPDC057488 TaxID=3346147 RepID=UPI00366D4580
MALLHLFELRDALSMRTEASGSDELSPMQAAHRQEVEARSEASGWLIQRQTGERRSRLLPRPIPTRCTALAYNGRTVTVLGEVVAVSGPWRWFAAEYPGWGTWLTVVHVDACEYLV